MPTSTCASVILSSIFLSFKKAIDGKKYSLSKEFSSFPLIIDSGALDHMTGDNCVFSSCNICSNSCVTLADDSSSKIVEVGTANPSQSLSLEFSLYIL